MDHYVYVLQTSKAKTYVGLTTDLEKRMNEHNSGLSYYTKRYEGDWELKWFCCFKNRDKAEKFERYLKTGSGIAFFKKRLL